MPYAIVFVATMAASMVLEQISCPSGWEWQHRLMAWDEFGYPTLGSRAPSCGNQRAGKTIPGFSLRRRSGYSREPVAEFVLRCDSEVDSAQWNRAFRTADMFSQMSKQGFACNRSVWE